MHDAYIGLRSENNIKCVVMHNNFGRKNRRTRYNCRFSAAFSGFTSDFLSFIVVEHIRFFYGALQLFTNVYQIWQIAAAVKAEQCLLKAFT